MSENCFVGKSYRRTILRTTRIYKSTEMYSHHQHVERYGQTFRSQTKRVELSFESCFEETTRDVHEMHIETYQKRVSMDTSNSCEPSLRSKRSRCRFLSEVPSYETHDGNDTSPVNHFRFVRNDKPMRRTHERLYQQSDIAPMSTFQEEDVDAMIANTYCRKASISEQNGGTSIIRMKLIKLGSYGRGGNDGQERIEVDRSGDVVLEYRLCDRKHGYGKKLRLVDMDGMKLRVACVCFRLNHPDMLLMVSSKRHENRWLFPGGGVEKDELTEQAALREAMEEAGVSGTIEHELGRFQDLISGHRTVVFAMMVQRIFDDKWPERDQRERMWFSVDAAKKQLQLYKPSQLCYLSAFLDYFKHRRQRRSIALVGDRSRPTK